MSAGRPGDAQSRPKTLHPKSWNDAAIRVLENAATTPSSCILCSAACTSRCPCPAPRHSGRIATRSSTAAFTGADPIMIVRGAISM